MPLDDHSLFNSLVLVFRDSTSEFLNTLSLLRRCSSFGNVAEFAAKGVRECFANGLFILALTRKIKAVEFD